MNGTVWIAEDDPFVRLSLATALRQRGLIVVETADPKDAKLWLTTPTRPVILDGSVWLKTEIPLERLSPAVLLFSADDDLVEAARAKGVRAFLKGNLQDYQALLVAVQEVVR